MSKKDHIKPVDDEQPTDEQSAAELAEPIAEESSPSVAEPTETVPTHRAVVEAKVPVDDYRDLGLAQTNHIHIPRESAWRSIAPSLVVIGVLLLVGAILWVASEREKNLLQLVLEGAEAVA
jgi:hypothetical protein